MTYPKITVVTPSFNQGQFIEKTIESVLSQGYPNLEYIIIDGGSKDNTVEIIKKYEKYLTYWISETDRGQSHAINKGFALATGSILTWLNSDDWFTSGALNCFLTAREADPECHVWVGDGDMISPDGKIVYRPAYEGEITLETLFHWLAGHDFMQPSAAFSREAWKVCGPLDENEHIALDLDFWLRIAKANFRFARIPDLLSHSLAHPSAKTTAFREQMYMEAALVIARHGGHHAVKQLMVERVKRFQACQEKLDWYIRNFSLVTGKPSVRLLRRFLKFASKDMSGVWEVVPPNLPKQ